MILNSWFTLNKTAILLYSKFSGSGRPGPTVQSLESGIVANQSRLYVPINGSTEKLGKTQSPDYKGTKVQRHEANSQKQIDGMVGIIRTKRLVRGDKTIWHRRDREWRLIKQERRRQRHTGV